MHGWLDATEEEGLWQAWGQQTKAGNAFCSGQSWGKGGYPPTIVDTSLICGRLFGSRWMACFGEPEGCDMFFLPSRRQEESRGTAARGHLVPMG